MDAATATWRDVFQQAALSVEQKGPASERPAKNAESDSSKRLLDADWAATRATTRISAAISALSDDGADDEDEPLSGSARGSGDDLGGDSGDEAASSDAVRSDRRSALERRAPVDAESSTRDVRDGETFEGEAEDEKTGGWGPPAKKKSVARLGKNTANATSRTRSQNEARGRARKIRKKTPSLRGGSFRTRARRGARVRLRRETGAAGCRLESDLGLNQHQIKVWFQNRRRKEKA